MCVIGGGRKGGSRIFSHERMLIVAPHIRVVHVHGRASADLVSALLRSWSASEIADSPRVLFKAGAEVIPAVTGILNPTARLGIVS